MQAVISHENETARRYDRAFMPWKEMLLHPGDRYKRENKQGGAMRIGLCLSGGANKGSWQEGVVTALKSRGIVFDRIAGTSIGSVVGAMHAAAMPEERRAWWWENLTWGKITNMKFPPIIAGLCSKSFYSGEKMKKLLTAELPKTFEELKTPLVTTATDIMAGIEGQGLLYLSSGDLIRAIQASVAIPGIFPPVEVGGQILVDGGIGNYIPLEVFKGYDYVYVLITSFGPPEQPPKNALEMIFRANDVWQQLEIVKELNDHGQDWPRVIPIWNRHPEIVRSSIMDWLHGKEWIEMGKWDGMHAPLPKSSRKGA